MNETKSIKRRPLHFGITLIISICLFNFAFIIDQFFRWSDHIRGLQNGLFHTIFYSMGWCIYFLPWSFLIYGIYKWRKLQKYRTHWIVAPSILPLIFVLWSFITNPPTPHKRFKSLTKVDLPRDLKNLNHHFSGGGIADYLDTYYFETSPEKIDKLISQLQVTLDEHYETELSHSIVPVLNGSPNYKEWSDAKQYKNNEGTWFYYLITNNNKTQVYIVVGCI